MPRKNPRPHIVWFRDDLRLSDHPALTAAAQSGAGVICLCVFDQHSLALGPPRARALGGAARWWLAQSLKALGAGLNALGAPLVLRKGPAADVIVAPAREVDAACVCWNEIATVPQQAVADGVGAALTEIGVASQSFPGDLLVHPTAIRNQEGRGLRVFTPFWNPVLQGEKFDPDGGYVRRWVPELAKLPPRLIHQPWTATPLELATAGVSLGKTYPQPIVDHRAGRERVLAAYATVRNA
jgi:deoxyribodipyrimidine photolyase